MIFFTTAVPSAILLALLCALLSASLVVSQDEVGTCRDGSNGFIVHFGAGCCYRLGQPRKKWRAEAKSTNQEAGVAVFSPAEDASDQLTLCIDYEKVFGNVVGNFSAIIYLVNEEQEEDTYSSGSSYDGSNSQRIVLNIDLGTTDIKKAQSIWIQSRPDDTQFHAGSQDALPTIAPIARAAFATTPLDEGLSSRSTPNDVLYGSLYEQLYVALCAEVCIS